MGSSSAVSITNWDGMAVPLNNMLNTSMTNHGDWYNEYRQEMAIWREIQTKAQADWLKINYGYPDDPYQKGVDGSGGVYGDARRSESLWRKVQLAIAGMQQVASFYFADKAYKASKEAQDHQIEVWETEKEWAQRYQDIWYYKYLPLEMTLLNLIKGRANDENYAKPKYDVAQSRAGMLVRKQFAEAREQLRKCTDPRQVGAYCDAMKQLRIEEARSMVGAIDRAYRYEEQRAETKQAQLEESMFNLSKFGRGLQADSLGALNSASQASQNAGQYKPYAGYQQAVGNAFGYWHQFSADRSVNQGANAQRIQGQANGYMQTFGAQSLPSSLIQQPQVTGNTGVYTNSNGFVQGLNYSQNNNATAELFDNLNTVGGGFSNTASSQYNA